MDVRLRNNVTESGRLSARQSIVFVHGFGTDQTFWRLVCRGFEQTHRLVLLDNVGAGRSQPSAYAQHQYLNLNRYADDLIEVVEHLRLEGPVVVGHSAGGMMAALAAVRRPALFSKLVLLGSSPRYLDDDGYHGGFTRADVDRVYQAALSNFEGWVDSLSRLVIDAPAHPDAAQEFARSLSNVGPGSVITVLCAILQSDHRQEIRKIPIPTLILQSRNDCFVPQDVSTYLRDHIRGSTLVEIDATGHFPQLTAPQEVIQALGHFVQDGARAG